MGKFSAKKTPHTKNPKFYQKHAPFSCKELKTH